jgi:3-oxo-5-alpha-steroid 4-dehydrogenase
MFFNLESRGVANVKLACSVVYFVWIVLVLLSLLVPFLRELSSHGKTIKNHYTVTSKTTGSDKAEKTIQASDAVSLLRQRKGNKSNGSHSTAGDIKECCSAPSLDRHRSTFSKKNENGSKLAICRLVQDLLFDERRMWVSKQYFAHFYLAGMASLVFTFLLVASSTPAASTLPTGAVRLPIIPTLLLATHLCRRYWECCRVHQWHGRMHVAGYLLGIIHYLILPASLIQVADRGRGVRADLTLGMALLCFFAQFQQYRHHVILAKIRSLNNRTDSTSSLKDSRGDADNGSSRCDVNGLVPAVNESTYLLPTGGWFSVIACPHYLAEVLIYTTLAILLETEYHKGSANETDSQVENGRGLLLYSFLVHRTHWMLLLWVTSNLTVSAHRTHQWYRQQYPLTPSRPPVSRGAVSVMKRQGDGHSAKDHSMGGGGAPPYAIFPYLF